METKVVIAAAGLRLPVENQPGKFIDDKQPVTIEISHYYERALLDGDIREATADEVAVFEKAQKDAEASALKALKDAEAKALADAKKASDKATA